MKKYCKHCTHEFEARRKNHVYCCPSCKTLASYKRNNYKYIAGHYQKDNSLQIRTSDSLKNSSINVEEKLNTFNSKKEGINLNSVSNAALGTAASDSIVYGMKKVFAPNTLPATKGDVETLKKEIIELKTILQFKKPIL